MIRPIRPIQPHQPLSDEQVCERAAQLMALGLRRRRVMVIICPITHAPTPAAQTSIYRQPDTVQISRQEPPAAQPQATEPPLIAGGQGRSAREIEQDGTIVGLISIAFLVIAAAAALHWVLS